MRCAECGEGTAVCGEDLCNSCINQRNRKKRKRGYRRKKGRVKAECLRCENEFWSYGNFNRICKVCRYINSDLAGGLDERHTFI